MPIDQALQKLFPESQIVEFEPRAVPVIIYHSITQLWGDGEERTRTTDTQKISHSRCLCLEGKRPAVLELLQSNRQDTRDYEHPTQLLLWNHWPTDDDWVGWLLKIRAGTTVFSGTAIESVWLETEINGLRMAGWIAPVFAEITNHLSVILQHPGYRSKGVYRI